MSGLTSASLSPRHRSSSHRTTSPRMMAGLISSLVYLLPQFMHLALANDPCASTRRSSRRPAIDSRVSMFCVLRRGARRVSGAPSSSRRAGRAPAAVQEPLVLQETKKVMAGRRLEVAGVQFRREGVERLGPLHEVVDVKDGFGAAAAVRGRTAGQPGAPGETGMRGTH